MKIKMMIYIDINQICMRRTFKTGSRQFYERLRSTVDEPTAIQYLYKYKENQSDPHVFHTCIACYLYSPESIRRIYDEELEGLGKIIPCCKKLTGELSYFGKTRHDSEDAGAMLPDHASF